MKKIYGTLFILTGLFAIAGGLYTWGDGSILSQYDLVKIMIPWADIIFTGPLSIICGFGILRNQYWATILGLVTSGVYIFGSILVFISLIWNKDCSIFLIIPAISGLLIGLGFITVIIKKNRNSNNHIVNT
jgi:hypothetical protein